MEYPVPPVLDSSQDLYEFGLIAAASPDFAEALVRALLTTREPEAVPERAGELRVAA